MKISIITPTYNHARFIQRTIDSVINQSGDFDMEYIIMDGGSKDGTVDILKSYDKLFKKKEIGKGFRSFKFTWVSEKDDGQSDAINKGLKLAKGDIVAYINSDDTYENGALQKVYNYFQAHPQEKFLTGFCKIINEDDKEIRRWITAYKNFYLRRASFARLLTENFISQPATFWKSEIHKDIGYFEKAAHFVMDYDMWCRIASKHKINVLPEMLAAFRWYDTSKSGENLVQQFNEQYEVASKYLKKGSYQDYLHRFNVLKIITIYKIMGFIRNSIRRIK